MKSTSILSIVWIGEIYSPETIEEVLTTDKTMDCVDDTDMREVTSLERGVFYRRRIICVISAEGEHKIEW